MKEFREALKEFKPKAVVIGGLQMMDNYPHKEGMLVNSGFLIDMAPVLLTLVDSGILYNHITLGCLIYLCCKFTEESVQN